MTIIALGFALLLLVVTAIVGNYSATMRDDQMQNAIHHGITKINIYSDVVGVMNKGLKDKLNAIDNPSTWPFIVFADARKMMKDVVRDKLRTFGSAGRL